MSMTKAEIRTAVQQAIDDVGAKRWPAASLDVLIALTIDDLWGDILDASSFYTSKLELPTIVAPGRIALSGLASRFYRLQKVVRDSYEYFDAGQTDVVIEGLISTLEEISAPDKSYVLVDENLWLFPLDATEPVTVAYSYLPPVYTTLAEGAAVVFPDGNESAIVYESASRALVRGDAESMAQVKVLAELAKNKLLSRVQRRRYGPTVMNVTGSPADYGSD